MASMGGPQIAALAVILVLGGISPARGERADNPAHVHGRSWARGLPACNETFGRPRLRG
jgi:hypothetical protein